jgi:hypothetical protein
MTDEQEWPGPRGGERSMSLAQFEVFQKVQAKKKAEREAELAEWARLRADNEKLREALHKIESGSLPGIVDLVLAGNWHAVVDLMQAEARKALGEDTP